LIESDEKYKKFIVGLGVFLILLESASSLFQT